MIIGMNTLNCLSALCAIVAAVLWFKSAIISLPNQFNIYVVKPNELPMGGNPLGGVYMGNAYSEDIENLRVALVRQSSLSAKAAIFAGLSAVMQAGTFALAVLKN